MSKKLKVKEEVSIARRIGIILIVVPIGLIGAFGLLALALSPSILNAFWSGEGFQLQWFLLSIVVLLFVFGLIGLIILLLRVGRPQIEVTPLLFSKPSIKGYTDYALCDEGVVFYSLIGTTLCRWNKIKSFTIDRAARVVNLTLHPRGTVPLLAIDKFEEVVSILSKYIPLSAS
jgi:hypothetical protein